MSVFLAALLLSWTVQKDKSSNHFPVQQRKESKMKLINQDGKKVVARPTVSAAKKKNNV